MKTNRFLFALFLCSCGVSGPPQPYFITTPEDSDSMEEVRVLPSPSPSPVPVSKKPNRVKKTK
jgi:hypothetical protein